MELLSGALFIFGARVIDVSLGTVRTVMVVRGRRFQAAALGFFEVIVYIVALQSVVGNLNNFINIFSYGLGFATGNIVGGYIEEKMAIGVLTVQIISKSHHHKSLLDDLRNSGFGVTVVEGEGREGTRYILNITIKRKDLPRLLKIVDQWDVGAFTTILDTRGTRGGYIRKAK